MSPVGDSELDSRHKHLDFYRYQAFYGYIKSKQKGSTKIQQLKKEETNDNFTIRKEEAAGELSKFFKSVYANENTSNIQ
jgi:hypothetical protein